MVLRPFSYSSQRSSISNRRLPTTSMLWFWCVEAAENANRRERRSITRNGEKKNHHFIIRHSTLHHDAPLGGKGVESTSPSLFTLTKATAFNAFHSPFHFLILSRFSSVVTSGTINPLVSSSATSLSFTDRKLSNRFGIGLFFLRSDSSSCISASCRLIYVWTARRMFCAETGVCVSVMFFSKKCTLSTEVARVSKHDQLNATYYQINVYLR